MLACTLLGADIMVSLSRWRRAPLTMLRHLPRGFAVGVPVTLSLSFENPSEFRRKGRFFEIGDATLDMPGMPLHFDLGPGQARNGAVQTHAPDARHETL